MESADLGKSEMNSVEEKIQLVTFKLGKEEFGFDILKVREINKMMSMTKVPGAPAFMEGIMNLRGHVIPVINLRRLMGMENREYNRETSIVVIDIPGKTYGFIVDAVREVLRIPVTVTEPPPALTAGVESGFVTSIAKLDDRLLFLLDIEKVTAFDAASKNLQIN